jgi:hypothetical protein
MATFDFTIDETFVGATIGPVDGFVVNLKRTKAGPYDPPAFSEAKQQWTNGRLVLRGSRDYRNLMCIDTQSDGYWASQYGNTASVLNNASVSYPGELTVVCVPKGSVWEITLSDIPYVRAPVTAAEWWSSLTGKSKPVSGQPELEPVLRR